MNKKEFNLPEQIKVKEYIENVDFPGYYKQNHGFQCWLIDQKVTYDILNLICKCILNKYGDEPDTPFHHKDFLDDKYSRDLFYSRTSSNGKAILSDKTTKEYDKLFWNNFEFLSYLNILEKTGRKRYKICNIRMLDLLSKSSDACIAIICISMDKFKDVMQNVKFEFDNFLSNPNAINKKQIKKEFIKWMQINTRHNKDITQIYCKFINPLFYLYNCEKFKQRKETKWLKQSLYDLQYCRIHQRDTKKTPGFTRKEYKEEKNYENVSKITWITLNEQTQKNKVKKWNQEYYNSESSDIYFSEFNDKKCINGVDVHHIWPKSEFNNNCLISPHVVENLIILDNNQHRGLAHDKGNVTTINKDNLNTILGKQFKKIIEFNLKRIGQYDLKQFYNLVCFIKHLNPIECKTDEELKASIEEAVYHTLN